MEKFELDIFSVLNNTLKVNQNGNVILNAKNGFLILNDLNLKVAIEKIYINISLYGGSISFKTSENNYIKSEEFLKVLDKKTKEEKSKIFAKFLNADLQFFMGNDLVTLKDYVIFDGINFLMHAKGGIKSTRGYCKVVINKNNKEFEDNDNIKIWKIIQDIKIVQSNPLFFKDINLKGLSINSYKNTKSNKLFPSFTGYFCYDNNLKYSDYDSLELFNNISKLLYFYTSRLMNFFITFVQDCTGEKCEIIITTKNNEINTGNSIFDYAWPTSLYDFIDSSYSNYLNLKQRNDIIDYLIYYYINFKSRELLEFKFVSGSIFLEVLKNLGKEDKYNDLDLFNSNARFYEKLDFVVSNKLNLNTNAMLKKIQPSVFKTFDEIQLFCYCYCCHNNRLSKVLIGAKNVFLLYNLTYLRNNSIHEGQIKMDEKFFRKIFNGVNNNLSNNTNLFKKGKNSKKYIPIVFPLDKKPYTMKKFINSNEINNIFYQNNILEHFMEIILLRLLGSEACLSNNDFFNHQKSNNYLNQFLKK